MHADHGRKNKIISAVLISLAVSVVVFICIFCRPGSAAEEKVSSLYNKAVKSVGAVADYSGYGIAVHYIDVGQGDCQLVICGDHNMFIDAGESGNEEKVTDYLRLNGVEKLDYVVVSHPHTDHIGSMAEVISSFKVENVVVQQLSEELTPATKCYSDLIDAILESGADVVSAHPGFSFDLGEAKVTILGPSYLAEDLNNCSIILRVDYKNSSFLFQADAEKEEEQSVLEHGADVDCDVLKVGHHGSSTSSCEQYIDAVSPQIAIISCGKDNEYGHPHDTAVNMIKKHTNKIYRTDLCSDIVVVSDGDSYDVRYSKKR